jgi:glycosyltransferase involved in cell wall biosynthesis
MGRGSKTELDGSKATIIIPCRNEEETISNVIKNLITVLPLAEILVVDNGSTDQTSEFAIASGARVLYEPLRGKGHAVAAGLDAVETEYVILIDGDSTYDEKDAPQILKDLIDGWDMVVANRKSLNSKTFRRGHKLGNYLLSKVQHKMLKVKVVDTLSGYRGFSKNFVRNFTQVSRGFEIEANLNIYSSIVGARVQNFDSKYSERPLNSSSKLNTYADGVKILFTIFKLIMTWRPLIAYSVFGALGIITGFILISVPILEFYTTGEILHLPTLIMSALIIFFSASVIFLGLVANLIVNFRIENAKRDYKLFKSISS